MKNAKSETIMMMGRSCIVAGSFLANADGYFYSVKCRRALQSTYGDQLVVACPTAGVLIRVSFKKRMLEPLACVTMMPSWITHIDTSSSCAVPRPLESGS